MSAWSRSRGMASVICPQDAIGAGCRLDHGPFEGEHGAVAGAQAKLQFGAANFDAEIHVAIVGTSLREVPGRSPRVRQRASCCGRFVASSLFPRSACARCLQSRCIGRTVMLRCTCSLPPDVACAPADPVLHGSSWSLLHANEPSPACLPGGVFAAFPAGPCTGSRRGPHTKRRWPTISAPCCRAISMIAEPATCPKKRAKRPSRRKSRTTLSDFGSSRFARN